MEKLKLNLDDLQVESFATEPEAVEGRVVGYYGTKHTEPDATCGAITICFMTCPGENTCQISCNGGYEYTCDYTCNWGCG